jgi:hypothetical protein
MNSICLLVAALGIGLARPDVEFRVFQCPADQIPRIDGNVEGVPLATRGHRPRWKR